MTTQEHVEAVRLLGGAAVFLLLLGAGSFILCGGFLFTSDEVNQAVIEFRDGN